MMIIIADGFFENSKLRFAKPAPYLVDGRVVVVSALVPPFAVDHRQPFFLACLKGGLGRLGVCQLNRKVEEPSRSQRPVEVPQDEGPLFWGDKFQRIHT